MGIMKDIYQRNTTMFVRAAVKASLATEGAASQDGYDSMLGILPERGRMEEFDQRINSLKENRPQTLNRLGRRVEAGQILDIWVRA